MAEKPCISSYDPEADDFERVGGQLTAYTQSQKAAPYNPVSFAFKATSRETGKHVGEALATINQGEAELNLLFVEEENRGTGIGRELVACFENEARRRGAISAIIKTPTWQGVGFYERLGYAEAMRIPIAPDANGKAHFNVTYYKDLRA